MIELPKFARVMGTFADRIGKPLTKDTLRLYYAVLSASLTTEQFLAGAAIVFRTHAYNTWPAPQQFIDAVLPPAASTLSAAEAFERVLAIASRSSIPPHERDAAIAAFGAVVVRAYRAAGGRRRFENILDDDVTWARRDFIGAYEGAISEEARATDAAIALDAADAGPIELQDPRAACRLLVDTVADLRKMPRVLPRGASQLAGSGLPVGERREADR